MSYSFIKKCIYYFVQVGRRFYYHMLAKREKLENTLLVVEVQYLVIQEYTLCLILHCIMYEISCMKKASVSFYTFMFQTYGQMKALESRYIVILRA